METRGRIGSAACIITSSGSLQHPFTRSEALSNTAHNARPVTVLPSHPTALLQYLQEHDLPPRQTPADLVASAREIDALGLGWDAALAAALFPLWDAGALSLDGIEPGRRQRIEGLLNGVRQLAVIDELDPARLQTTDGHEQSERARKMLLAMVQDARTVIIKIASRLRELRQARWLPDAERRRLARHTLEVYAPLANRLGIWQLKWELEDRALRYLDPETYRRIASWLAERRNDREAYINRVVGELQQALTDQGLVATVYGRPKHIYSIWRKLRRKGIGFDSLFDVRAVRVLVEDVRDCYAALGIVHSHWQPIPGQFDDYIAAPKDNLYQSLHTAVLGRGDKTLEVQIRTHRMHEHAELGVAAHWRYKEGARPDPGFDRRIGWLRALLQDRPATGGEGDFLARFRTELLHERVYVLTPRGAVIDLPRGATVLDFAYAIHTELGHRCRGARVNGAMTPLTRVLDNGDRVEILTGREPRPSRDWLLPQLGYLASARARAKVRRWFRQQDRDTHVAQGRLLLERELQRLGLPEHSYEDLAGRLGYRQVGTFLAALGRGDVTAGRIAGCLRCETDSLSIARPRPTRSDGAGQRRADAVRVRGIDNLLLTVARCCRPVPPEPIGGYVTRLRGVSIHRADCHNFLRLSRQAPERVIEVSWGERRAPNYPVRILVTAHDRAGLLRDISTLISGERINVLGVSTSTDPDTRIARMDMRVEVSDLPQLTRVLNRLARLRNVTEARRISD